MWTKRMFTVCWISIVDWVRLVGWLLLLIFEEGEHIHNWVCVVNREIPFSFRWSNLFRWFTSRALYFRLIFIFFIFVVFFFVVVDHFMYVIHIMPQFTVYRLFVFDHSGGRLNRKSFLRVLSVTHTHTCTQHILSDLWQNIHSVDIFIALWTIKSEEAAAAAARDNLWPKLISSVTECRICLCVCQHSLLVDMVQM